jgi:hypothetical protein
MKVRFYTERVGYNRGTDRIIDICSWAMIACGQSLTVYEIIVFNRRLSIELS